jgi:outer membrane protein TolC
MNKDSLSRMRGRPAAAVVGVLLALAPSMARAEDASLTLETAVRLALTRNERALAADAEVKAAEARVTRARSFFMPTLTTTGTYTRRPFEVSRKVGDTNIVIQSYNAIAAVAQVNMTLFDAKSLPGLLQANSERDAQRFASAESRRQLSFEVSNAFLASLGTDQVLEASRNRFEYARQSLEAAKARYAAGLVSVNDVTRAELEYATAEMGVIQVKGQVETTYLELGFLLDDPEAARKKLAIPEFLLQGAEGGPASAEQMVAEAQDRRLDLGSLRYHAKAQRALLIGPTLSWLPSLSFNGQYRYTNESGLTGRPTNWNLGLTMTWAVFDGFSRNADYRERKALAVLADLDVKTAMRKVELDVRDALVSLDNQRATLKQAVVARDVARKNATETAELYRQGLTTALQAADANVSLFEAEVELVRERYGLGIAFLNLEAALGLDPFGKEPTL